MKPCTCSAQDSVKESLIVREGNVWRCEGCLTYSTLCGRLITRKDLIKKETKMLVVFDVDDTLSKVGDRADYLNQEPKDWDSYFDACHLDEPNKAVTRLARELLISGNQVEVWTGRPERLREKTQNWLIANGIPVRGTTPRARNMVELRMRPDGDFRTDIELKGQWLANSPKPDLMFDDRSKSVAHWRSLGITVCQVADNDF